MVCLPLHPLSFFSSLFGSEMILLSLWDMHFCRRGGGMWEGHLDLCMRFPWQLSPIFFWLVIMGCHPHSSPNSHVSTVSIVKNRKACGGGGRRITRRGGFFFYGNELKSETIVFFFMSVILFHEEWSEECVDKERVRMKKVCWVREGRSRTEKGVGGRPPPKPGKAAWRGLKPASQFEHSNNTLTWIICKA